MTELVIKQPKPTGGAKEVGGSEFEPFNIGLLSRIAACVKPAPSEDPAAVELHYQTLGLEVGLALRAFDLKDEIEGMIAGQAVALHHASIECLRRAMLVGQNPEVASKLRKDGANLARAMTDMLAALDRKRGKGQQHIRVERVVVQEGGQAVVGNVQTGRTLPQPNRAAGRIVADEQRPMVLIQPASEGEAVLLDAEGEAGGDV